MLEPKLILNSFHLVPPSSQRLQTTLLSANEIAKIHKSPWNLIGFTLTSSDPSFPHEDETLQLQAI